VAFPSGQKKPQIVTTYTFWGTPGARPPGINNAQTLPRLPTQSPPQTDAHDELPTHRLDEVA